MTTGTARTAGTLETVLRERRDGGRKLLVPYVTAGVCANWVDFVVAAMDAGADAVEIGIPFSDPVIDGPTIQRASVRALARGTTPDTALGDLGGIDRSVPLIAMTYYNLVFQAGHRSFATRLCDGGVCGLIVPDLPVDESAGLTDDAAAAGVDTVLLAAPVTPEDRLAVICQRSRGFVYGMGLMGVTGERTSLASSATAMARRLKAATDMPVLIGVGVSTPQYAAEICADADGVAIGAPLMRRVLEGQPPGAVAELVGAFRQALDQCGDQ
ncbi:MAG TPA: tryptophan synthase subunit alpha [Mycobacteriales bacterium]|nr:tryptophan synthase subunit alpha [Mycobacteriales bacterium]